MIKRYLVCEYRDKDQVKALGARWDVDRRQWYVPAGLDLAPFSAWLPTNPNASVVHVAAPVAGYAVSESTPVASLRGVSLSQLLSGVSAVVAQAFGQGVWTTVEVVDARVRGAGHVYLEVSERNALGDVTAKASAVIWGSVAARIVPAFEQATGAQLAPGIKLLVRARPVFKAQYGFSLEIDAVDAEYTLGDLEARKREIRERLQSEGLFHRNRSLPAPWDFNAVLVVAPEGGAGLGDFQAEAQRLQDHGVCQFVYVFSRFQGDGAAAEVRSALTSALAQWGLNHKHPPDLVVVIRGGGAVNDLAWLNDYDLTRTLCELDVPVWTGIGHERDNTLLDEVAHQRFDTPSKVIAGIESLIRLRVQEVRWAYEQVRVQAQRAVADWKHHCEQAHQSVAWGARQALTLQRREAAQALVDVQQQSRFRLLTAVAQSRQRWDEIQLAARQSVQRAQRELPQTLQAVVDGARRQVRSAREQTTSTLREIAGQGPEKTLQRGFAIVQTADGRAVTRAADATPEVLIRFHDGQRAATLKEPCP